MIELPWPPRDVSPNARGHWAKKARAVKAYRDACGWELIAQNAPKLKAERIAYSMTFHPPGDYAYDDDNLVARMKAGIDAVATYIDIDDSKWTLRSISRGEPKPKVGAVVIELEAA
jgi:crossover junction endodeoxyribonuclease RusA